MLEYVNKKLENIENESTYDYNWFDCRSEVDKLIEKAIGCQS